MKLAFTLYLLMALSTAVASFLGTDEAAKYIVPEWLFWARGMNTVVGSVAIALKAWTSSGFQEWVNKKQVEKASP